MSRQAMGVIAPLLLPLPGADPWVGPDPLAAEDDEGGRPEPAPRPRTDPFEKPAGCNEAVDAAPDAGEVLPADAST